MGLFSKLIDNLPVELHLKGYNYCGPGTKLRQRLARGDPGINFLDEACKRHDIAYSQSKETEKRHIADRELAEAAWKIVKSPDSTFGEKAAAWAVTTAMKAKVKMGLGLRRKSKKSGRGLKKKCGRGMKGKRKGVKRGGILPLLPIFAGLSALGALSGGAAGIARAVNDSKTKSKELAEFKRHNQHMEALAAGRGMILKPYKKGSGMKRKTSKKKKN